MLEGDSPSKVRIKAVPLPHQSTSANLIGLIMRPCYHGPRLPPKWKVSNRGSLYRLASHPSNLRTESRVTHIPRQGDKVRGPIYIAGSCQEGKPFQQEELFEKVRQHLPSSPSRAQIMYSGASFDVSKEQRRVRNRGSPWTNCELFTSNPHSGEMRTCWRSRSAILPWRPTRITICRSTK